MEGSVENIFLNIIKKHGYNKEITIEIAKVFSLSPLSFKLEKDGLTLTQDDVVVAEVLTPKNQVITVAGNPYTIEIRKGLSIGDRVILISDEDSQLFFAIDRVGVL